MDETDQLAIELYAKWQHGFDMANPPVAMSCESCGFEKATPSLAPNWRMLNTNQKLVWINLAEFVQERFSRK